MGIQNGYCILGELQKWNTASQAVDAAILERAIEACSRGIDQFTQRHFWQATGARLFDACDPHVLKFGVFNDVSAVTQVRTDENRDGVFETTWAATDWQPGPLNLAAAPEPRPYRYLRAIGARNFPRRYTNRDREGLIEVTGTWGWDAIPHGVNQACLIHAARIFTRKESPQGVAGWGEFGAIRVGRTDPDVIAFLDPCVHPDKVLAA